ncbi:MAG: NAD+ synthase [Candidatus Thermoplasmatota archaeon]
MPKAKRARTVPSKARLMRRGAQPREEPLFVEAGSVQWEATITTFIQRHIAAAGAKGIVLGMSGGLDSAVVGALCARALGKSKVLALWMPAPDSNPLDAKHAALVCKAIGVKLVTRPIGPIADGVLAALGTKPPAHASANAKSRARMILLYATAQTKSLLVCGTGNKSELLAGYFTKWGDGGCDLNPIGDLYKTQVRDLARYLKIPKPVIAKPPSAGLRPGQTDEGDLGVTYEELDAVLKGIELNHSLPAIARKTGLSAAKVAKVNELVRRSEHKRHLPLIPKIGARTVGIDWRRPVHWDG